MKCFRPARRSSVGWNVAKTLGQIVAFWGFFLNVVPAILVRFDPWPFPPVLALGIPLFVLMGTAGVFIGLTFAVFGEGTPLPLDQTTRFLVFGPYRFVRNPMAITGITQGLAVGLILGSPLVIAYALAGIPMWHLFARPSEEADLARRFGLPYVVYKREVPIWLPRRTAWEPSATSPLSGEASPESLASDQSGDSSVPSA